jgi:hypothetical protein
VRVLGEANDQFTARDLALIAVSMLWPPSSVFAERAFQRFLPLLVDLNGWQGKKPEGMSMEMTNNSMTTATRDYQRGAAQLHAAVVIGMNVQTTEGHMISSTMHGLSIIKTFNTKQSSGAIMVALGKDVLFSLSYNEINGDEALALAEKFDWKAIQAAAQVK